MVAPKKLSDQWTVHRWANPTKSQGLSYPVRGEFETRTVVAKNFTELCKKVKPYADRVFGVRLNVNI